MAEIIFVSGTKTFFNQTSAPTGWTKETTYDNYTIRITNGAPTGTVSGTENFTTCFASRSWGGTVSVNPATTGDTILDSTQIPAHTHQGVHAAWTESVLDGHGPSGSPTYPFVGIGYGKGPGVGYLDSYSPYANVGGGAHNHTITVSSVTPVTGGTANFSVNYCDFILCTKT